MGSFNLKWFKHDTDASIDAKLQELLLDYGASGYGLYWYCVELMCFDNKNKEDISTNRSLKSISKVLKMDILLVKQILNKMSSIGILKIIDKNISLLNHKNVLLLSNRANARDWEKIRKIIFERDNYTCSYCGKIGGRLECDHIHPLSRGGTDEENNLTTACFECNRKKGKKTIKEWIHNG